MALLFCLGTVFSRQAFAQNSPLVDLEGHADGQSAECMTRERLETEVLAELGPLQVPAGLSVQVELGGQAGFVLRDGDEIVSERRFESLPPDCAAQVKMLSVVIALAIEHKVSSDKETSQPVASGPPANEQLQTAVAPPLSESKADLSKPERKRTDTRLKSPVRVKPKKWGLRGSGGVGYSFGVLPVPAPIVTAEMGVVVWRGWSAEVGFLMTDRMRIGFDVEEPEGAEATAPDEAFSQALGQLVGGKAQGCWERFYQDGALGICGGVAAGRFHARGVEGFQPNPGQGVPWLAGFTRVVGRAPARGPFGLSLSADVFGNILRPGVELTGEGSAKSPIDTPVAGGAVSLGMFFVVQ